MNISDDQKVNFEIRTFEELMTKIDYSLLDFLNPDPQAIPDGNDHEPREVISGHYVPVTPTPIISPKYISHSKALFNELGLSEEIIKDKNFVGLFSGDISKIKEPMRPYGWATGYALSIYGKEYYQQCPFGNGNGYGDGRAISIYEGLFKGKRWEMQLKGGGPTPYCRGADGRAVLRSSIREFLAQEYMHELGVPSTRSLTLYVSQVEKVRRPWYTNNTRFIDPDIMLDSHVAITTRVAPSFLRVGQLELFARRARNNQNNNSLDELNLFVRYLIKRNYSENINPSFAFHDQILQLAILYRERIISLVTNWLRVGYCQGNFNSDNCSLDGITLDYGPFGFCEMFDPEFQPWTGGGKHFSFFNQPLAAELNYHMFINSLIPLFGDDNKALEKIDNIKNQFSVLMKENLNQMWIKKLGIEKYDEKLVTDLFSLMSLSRVDYTKFFRGLSSIPQKISSLKDSFYSPCSEQVYKYWDEWLTKWNHQIKKIDKLKDISSAMKLINPKYTWREWLIAEAYTKAEVGDYGMLNELQTVLSNPYDEQSNEIEKKYDRLRPSKYFNYGGISHYSCSS